MANDDASRKEMKLVENLEPQVWLERCARRIGEVDQEIADPEARRIARDLHKFERTRAMEPEAAVDFVAMALANPGRTPFERRRTHRD
jgi:gamma-glutamyl:cysteine ligase YbdK (ATP-grasp superfamily)